MDTTDLTITHERLDDLPPIFAMAERLKLAAVLDKALGRHGNHEGLSYGWLATVWIAYICPRETTASRWSRAGRSRGKGPWVC